MDTRDIGLLMVWVGAIALVAVLQHRIRSGAFSVEALDNPHPVSRWDKRIAGFGMALAVLGIGLTLWSFL